MSENGKGKSRPAVFLDRDGTLIEDRHYLSDPSQVVLLDGCIEGLLELSAKGYFLVMVTNQSGIARGLATHDQVNAVNQMVVRMLSVHNVTLDGIFLCPHHPDDQCNCRKPSTGMIGQATENLPIDIGQSWVIGDKCSDVLLGQNIGARTILLAPDESESEPLTLSCEATATVNGFCEAIAYVTSHSMEI